MRTRFFVPFFFLSLLCGCNAELRTPNVTESKYGSVIRFAQWNIGHFDFGNQPDSKIGINMYEERLQEYRDVLDSLDADVLAVCEYSEIFGENGLGYQYSKEVLFCGYPYYYEGRQNNYACNALFSRIEPRNIQSNAFNNLKTSYYYISSDLPLGNKNVKLVCAHLALSRSSDEYALLQIEELIQKYESEEYVIMMGDWNISDVDHYLLFQDAGYQLANHGLFGDIETFSKLKNSRNRILDNIMVKGFNISSVSVVTKDLSDHYPLVVSVLIDGAADGID